MQTTRQGILSFLETNYAASARQIARALQISAADVRYHIGALRRDGLVEAFRQENSESRGRPASFYRLTVPARRGNYLHLSRALLSAENENTPGFLKRVAQYLGGGESLPEKASLTRRLVEAVRILNELHYQARWEAHASAPQVRLDACPYAAILEEHPELCRIDAFLLEHLTGHPVKQTARLASSEDGVPYCLFSVSGARITSAGRLSE